MFIIYKAWFVQEVGGTYIGIESERNYKRERGCL